MMKKNIVYILSAVVLCSVCHADLFVKMETPVTDLLPGQTVTVTLSAWADDAAVTNLNGLNYWALSVLVDTTGVVEVVDGSLALLGPTPTGLFSMSQNSINDPITGGTGSVNYLNAFPSGSALATDTGYGDYTPIASFDIKATGGVNDSVTYTLGDTNGFLGILADGTTMLDGSFNAIDSQRVFTIVPEPATLALLGLGGVVSLRRKK